MMEPSQSPLGRVARFLVRRIVRFYYPNIEITGREQISDSGPVLLVANHANSLIDPVIMGIVADRQVHFLAKAPLFEIPFFGRLMCALGMLPAYRGSDDQSQVSSNLQSLAQAAGYLVRGETVGIFPEGKSHDAVKVDKVKSGAARIAVQAIQQGGEKIKIVPIGINYERKERFRSSIWVRVGRPIDLEEWKQKVAEDDRVAMRSLTSEIDKRLKEAVIHLDEEKWEPFLYDLESIVPAASQSKRTPIAALRQRKRVADAMNYFLANDRPRAEAIAKNINTHREDLKSVGLTIQSDLFRIRYLRLFVRQTWDIIWLLLGLIPALLGTLYNLPPFLVVRLAAKLIPAPNRSVVSLTRLALGLPIYSAWYVFVWFRLTDYFLPWVATVWSSLMFLGGVFSLNYWTRAATAGRLWWSELRMLLEKKRLEKLRQNHFQLRDRLIGLAQEYRKVQPPEKELPLRSWWWLIKRILSWGISISVAGVLLSWGLWWIQKNKLSILDHQGLELTQIPAPVLSSMLAEDNNSLVTILNGLSALEKNALKVQASIASGQHDFYTQADNDAVRQLLFTYLNYRTELLRLIWKYQNYAQVADEKMRLQTFLLELTAASSLYESSFKLVTQFAQTPAAIRKLNEGEPLWEIPPGLYDMVRANLIAAKNRRMMESAFGTYDKWKPRFADHALTSIPPYIFFHEVVAQTRKTTAGIDELLDKWKRTMPLEDAEKLGKNALYRGQSMVSTWVGDTRIRQPRAGQPLIRPKELSELRHLLQPGDILLERQNWYLSRAFMPGYWAHAAFYVGTTNDLIRMGLDKDPRVQPHWKEFAERDAAGHEHLILEAVPAGVRITTLEHCIGVADSAAVLRPRIPSDHLPEVIAQAFVHLGKPYDFEFDFFSTDKLVCTELVYRCCDKEIQFPLIEVMGRRTLPPTEIVRKFSNELGKPEAQLRFVAFLDGEESKSKASFKDEKAFAESVNRPSLTWLQDK